MNDLLSPDMNVTLLQAAQNKTAQSTKQITSAQQSRDVAKLEQTAEDFEAVFIAEMMKPMFSGLSTEAPFGGGKGEEVFRGMMIQEYGKLLAKTGAVGLSGALKEQMILMQETANAQSSTQSLATAEIATQTTLEGPLAHD
jgi:flagellar protein FlgJ